MSFSNLIVKLSNVSPAWLSSLKEESIFDLKVCNQPLVEYYFHLARHLGVEKVILCHPFYKESVWKYERIGHNFGIKIFCESSPEGEDIDFFKKRNKNLLAGEKSIIIKDPVFVFFDLKNNHIKRNLMRYRDDILVGVDTHQFFVTKKLDSLSSYFILTKSILEKYNDNYFFREFRVSQNGVFLGKNTKIRNASSVREASIIGSGALISHDSICKSCCVVSDYSRIGSGCELDGVIIYNSLQLKNDVSLKDKIVLEDRIIDPLTGEVSCMKSEGDSRSYGPPLSNRLASIFLIIFLFFPVLLVELLLFSFQKKNHSDSSIGGVAKGLVTDNNSLSNLYELFNWGVIRGLWRVVFGKSFLFGAKNLGKSGEQYIYSFTDFMSDRDFKVGADIFSRYYNFRRSLSYDIIIILRFYLSNLMQVIR